MAAAEVDELIGDLHERRDSLSEFRKLERDIRLETDFSSGFTSEVDDQSIPSAPPSSAGLDDCVAGARASNGSVGMFADYGRSAAKENEAYESIAADDSVDKSDGNVVIVNDSTDSIDVVDKNYYVEKPADMDTSSTKSLHGSLKEVNSLETKSRDRSSANEEDTSSELTSDLLNGTASARSPHSAETQTLNAGDDEMDEGAVERTEEEQVEQSSNNEKAAVIGNPTFVSPFGDRTTEVDRSDTVNGVNGVSDAKTTVVTEEKATNQTKINGKSIDEDTTDPSDDEEGEESRKTLESRTQDAIARKKADAAAREFEAKGKKTKTKVCAIL